MQTMGSQRPHYINSPSYKKRESSFIYKAVLLGIALGFVFLTVLAWGFGW